MTKGKALLGVLAGLAAGAAIGVLLAPGKGGRTRRNLVRKGEDLADSINDKIDKKFDAMVEALREKRKKTSRLDETVFKQDQ